MHGMLLYGRLKQLLNKCVPPSSIYNKNPDIFVQIKVTPFSTECDEDEMRVFAIRKVAIAMLRTNTFEPTNA